MNYVLFNHKTNSYADLNHSDKETAEKTALNWNQFYGTNQEWIALDYKEFQELYYAPGWQSLRR